METNEPVRVYDCSGPWGDESFHGDAEHGLPPLRRDWVLRRGDVEEVPDAAAAAGAPAARARPLRAKPGRVVTQLRYARQGIITPEMEYIAIRENMGRELPPQERRPKPAASSSIPASPSARPSPRKSPRNLSATKSPAGGPSFPATSTTPNWSR